MNQAELQNLLRTHLAESQNRNPSYSMRAFAKRLGVGFGTISEVLAGKRRLSAKSASKVLDQLGVSPLDRAKVLNAPKKPPSYEHTQLQGDQYFILSEWYYLAILNLTRVRDFKSTAADVSKRLGITLSLAKQAIDRLERVGLIRFEKAKMVRTHVALKTTDGVENAALRKSHYQSLERARVALDTHPFDSYDTSWLTFAFAPKDIEAARQKIREFQDEFAEQFSTSKEATEVYRLAMQLFSLTEPQPSTERKTLLKNGEKS